MEQVALFLSRPEAGKMIREILDEHWATFETPELDQEVLGKYRERFLTEREGKNNQPVVRPLWTKKWLRYAAVLLLTSAFGYFALLRPHKNDTVAVALLERKNPNGQRSVITLSDSTVVYLGAGSDLKFPENFTGATREIDLEGEAFFEVKKDHKHPFIIHTGAVQTKVLGTSFKIEAFKNHLLTVSVATGKVRVDQNLALPSHHLNSLAVLLPGQKVTYNAATDKAVTGLVAIADLQQWKKGNLIFNKERMDEVAEILERYYDVSISISGKELKAYEINTSFKPNESIDKVLQILSATANFKYTVQGKQITIRRRLMK